MTAFPKPVRKAKVPAARAEVERLREAAERALNSLDRCSACQGIKRRLAYADGDRERWETCRSCEGSGLSREGEKAAAAIRRALADPPAPTEEP